jgi:acyl transferase domain-containing protein/aryl carrier-like protein
MSRREPIAIVGIGCRFPAADGPDSFWRLLDDGLDAIGEVPSSRFDIDRFYDPRPGTPGRIVTRYGGFLEGIDEFEPAFFSIAPHEAIGMDPQQRLALEVSLHALEDAGIPPSLVAGSRTGVFIGCTNDDYAQLAVFRRAAEDVNLHWATGTARSTIAGRVSSVFGFAGPSIAVDTACSSSLVAVHLACRSLREDECTLALAGGVNVILLPSQTIAFSRAGMLAPDGRCKAFDARADGFVRSEGAGIVALKTLSDASTDGDAIYAVILGSGVSNDGASGGRLMTPAAHGQQAALRAAYRDAAVTPHDVAYVEAHGTGTAVGDPIEAAALGAVVGSGRPAAARPCLVGSVKTNIGHTESVAGVAGLIKVALALDRGKLPRSLHCERPNPAIPFRELGLEVQRAPRRLHRGRTLCGVSSFGISGTNAHVVLEDASTRPVSHPPRDELLPVSAQSPAALRGLAEAYRAFLTASPVARDVAYTASVRRMHREHRLAVVGSSPEELAARLEAFLDGGDHPTGARLSKLVFVYSGHGSQWPGMGVELLREERVFRESLERADAALREHLTWSVLDVLRDRGPRLESIEVGQPVLFALHVALTELWQSWGIAPEAVVGHSVGEVAAAWACGALDLPAAAQVIACRSRLLASASGNGEMIVVGLSLDEAQELVGGNDERVAVAAANGPSTTVLSGDAAVLRAISRALLDRDVFCRPIEVDVASHCPQVAPLMAELEQELAAVTPGPPKVPFYSTVTTRAEEDPLDARYWARNLREPVLFWQALAGIVADGCDGFLEISPHPLLVRGIRDGLAALGRPGTALASLRRDARERRSLLESLAALYVGGRSVTWDGLFDPRGRVVRLPGYRWQRTRFWLEDAGAAPGQRQPSTGLSLGASLSPAVRPGLHVWETTLAPTHDHCVLGTATLPLTAYAVMAAAAAEQVLGEGPSVIEGLTVERPLVFEADRPRTLQVELSSEGRDQASVRFLTGGSGSWTHLASTTVRRRRLRPRSTGTPPTSAASSAIDADEFYSRCASLGLEYGDGFRGVESVRATRGRALARLRFPVGGASEPASRAVLLDSAMQALLATVPDAGEEELRLPVSVARVEIRAWPIRESELWSEARMRRQNNREIGDVRVLDGHGTVLVECRGIELRRVRGHEAHRAPADWLYAPRWERAAGTDSAAHEGRIVIFTRGHPSERELVHELGRDGASVVLAADAAALAAVEGEADVLYLAGAESRSEPPHAAADECENLVRVVQTIAEIPATRASIRLWVITHGAQAVRGGERPALDQTPLWGLARTIGREHPELGCTLVDLGRRDGYSALREELQRNDGEDEVALRGGRRYVARLARLDTRRVRRVARDGRYRCEVWTPGGLDSLRLCPIAARRPGPREVEVCVRAAGVNFRDVMLALGLYPGAGDEPIQLGNEAAGTVTAVGDGVEAIEVGDRVLVITPSGRGCIASHVQVPAAFALPMPTRLDYAASASAPVAFVTAAYALERLARVASGERVLIHAAAGGVGLAAIQIARRAGAEVLATAGTREKRAYLASIGIEHVMDSRSLVFAERVLEVTGGRGVDVVLNSLSGDAIAAGLSVLAHEGRFVELGKRDIAANTQLGLKALEKGVSFMAVDLDRAMREREELVASIFRDVTASLDAGELTPLPHRVLPISRARAAFEDIARARLIGKIVLEPEPRVRLDANSSPVEIRADAAYLVTGGLGGLGWATARWLADRGAGRVVLMSRHAPTRSAAAEVARVRATGVEIVMTRGDVGSRADVERVLGEIRAAGRPLAGVIHAAGLLDDRVVLQLDREGIDRVFRPKVDGAWNLDEATRHEPLDFMVFYSSAASLLGSAGQGNYAAANAYLDALAVRRSRKGMRTLSVNWGPWARIGLAARSGVVDRLAVDGIEPIDPEVGLAALGFALAGGTGKAAQIGVLRADWRRWSEAAGTSHSPRVLALLDTEAPSPTARDRRFDRAVFLAAAPDARLELLRSYLADQLRDVLRLAPADLADIDGDVPFLRLGLDSLMALELRARMRRDLGSNLPIAALLDGTTLNDVVECLAAELGTM